MEESKGYGLQKIFSKDSQNFLNLAQMTLKNLQSMFIDKFPKNSSKDSQNTKFLKKFSKVPKNG